MAARGAQEQRHKYTKRTGSPGNYQYTYPKGFGKGPTGNRGRPKIATKATARATAQTRGTVQRKVAAIRSGRTVVRTGAKAATRTGVRPTVAASRTTLRPTATALRPKAIETAGQKVARLHRAAGFSNAPIKINVGSGVKITRQQLRGGALMAHNRKQAATLAATRARGVGPPPPVIAPEKPVKRLESLTSIRARRLRIEGNTDTVAAEQKLARRQQQVASTNERAARSAQLHQLRTQSIVARERTRADIARARVANLTPVRRGRGAGVLAGAGRLARRGVKGAVLASIGGAAIGGGIALASRPGTQRVWVGSGTVANVAPNGSIVSTSSQR